MVSTGAPFRHSETCLLSYTTLIMMETRCEERLRMECRMQEQWQEVALAHHQRVNPTKPHQNSCHFNKPCRGLVECFDLSWLRGSAAEESKQSWALLNQVGNQKVYLQALHANLEGWLARDGVGRVFLPLFWRLPSRAIRAALRWPGRRIFVRRVATDIDSLSASRGTRLQLAKREFLQLCGRCPY